MDTDAYHVDDVVQIAKEDLAQDKDRTEPLVYHAKERPIPFFVTQLILGIAMMAWYPWLVAVCVMSMIYAASLYVSISVHRVMFAIQVVGVVVYMVVDMVLLVNGEEDRLLLLLIAILCILSIISAGLYRKSMIELRTMAPII